MSEQFDPADHDLSEIRAYLEGVDAAERERVLLAERTGRNRITILRENGIDPDERIDASGRVLYPWETSPGKQPEVEELEVPDDTGPAEGGLPPAEGVGDGGDAGGVGAGDAGTSDLS